MEINEKIDTIFDIDKNIEFTFIIYILKNVFHFINVQT